MYDISISSILSQAGFKIRADGLVTCDGFEYGVLKGSKLVSGGKRIDLSDVDSIEYQNDFRRVIFFVEGRRAGTIIGVDSESGLRFETPVEKSVEEAMPRDSAAFDAVFERLFPEYRSQMFRDVLAEKDMAEGALIGRPEEGLREVDDEFMGDYHIFVLRTLKSMGFVGARGPSNEVMDEVFVSRMRGCMRNPFKEWVESHDWDGVPRLRHVFIDYLGVTAMSLRSESYGDDRSPEEMDYIESVTEAWFLGAIARMYGPCQHDVVPVLVGPQGAGKGTTLRFLAGKDMWYDSSTVNIMHPERFLDTARGKVIMELGEATQLRNRDAQEELKAFVSKAEDKYRKPYARKEQTFPRHFILAATTNYEDVFIDPTGSRRFYPMACGAVLGDKAHLLFERRPEAQHEVEQIWAEALQMYKEGHKPEVPKKVRDAALLVQKSATEVDPNVQALDEWLDGHIEYSMEGARICRKTILNEYFEIYEEREIPANISSIWKAWVRQTDKWHKAGKMMDVRGIKTSAAYIRNSDVGKPPMKLPEVKLRFEKNLGKRSNQNRYIQGMYT